MKVRIICFLGASGELASGIIGLACPPIAYWIDEKIQDNATINENSGLRGLHSDDIPSGNLYSKIRKSEYLSPLFPYLKQGVQKLNEYYDEDAVRECYEKTIEQVVLLGFLFSFQESLKSNSNAEFLDLMEPYMKEYHSDFNFGDHREGYENEWQHFKENAENVVAQLILYAVWNLELTENNFLEGKKENFADALDQHLLEDAHFRSLYRAMKGMSMAIYHADDEFYELILEKSELQRGRKNLFY